LLFGACPQPQTTSSSAIADMNAGCECKRVTVAAAMVMEGGFFILRDSTAKGIDVPRMHDPGTNLL